MPENPIQKSERRKRNDNIWRLHYELGFTYRDLSKKYGVSHSRIGQIIKDKQERLLRLPVRKKRLNKDVIIKCDDPLGIDGKKITLRNIKKVIRNINKNKILAKK